MDALADARCEDKVAAGRGIFSIRRAEEKDIAAALELYNYFVRNSACNFQENPDSIEESTAVFLQLFFTPSPAIFRV
jgi:hypothetical protein